MDVLRRFCGYEIKMIVLGLYIYISVSFKYIVSKNI